MIKLSKKIKRSLLGSTTLISFMSAFALGVNYSEPIKESMTAFKEFSEDKKGIATYSSISSALVVPGLVFGSYRTLTKKKRKLKKLDIEKKKLEILDLKNKLGDN